MDSSWANLGVGLLLLVFGGLARSAYINVIKRLDAIEDKAAKNTETAEERLKKDIIENAAEISGIGIRMSKEISALKDVVVYDARFQEYKIAQNDKHRMTEKMINMLEEQMRQSASANTAEHLRICGKLDAIPSMISEQMTSNMKAIVELARKERR